MEYNEGQKNAIAQISESLSPNTAKRKMLLGGAGTGKTTVIQEIIKQYQQKTGNDDRLICIAAPTNKAVKVAKRMASERGLSGVEFSTLHSLLGLKVSERQGRKELKQREVEPIEDSYSAIFVDESSMIDKEITQEFFSKTGRVNIVGIGDPYQLYPVKCNESPFFKQFSTDDTCCLTETMRQKGSPAGYLVDLCRLSVQKKANKFDPRQYPQYFINHENKGAWQLESEDFFKLFSTSIGKNKNHAEWDATRFLAYKHTTIAQTNKWLRESLYGEKALSSDYLPGEPVIALSPVIRQQTDEEDQSVTEAIKLPTASEMIIETVNLFRETVTLWADGQQEDFTYDFYDCFAANETTSLNLRLLGTAEKERYDNDLIRLSKLATANPSLWRSYYTLKKFVDDCRVAYGLTVYSSQGSTFNNVFIHGDDISSIRNQESVRRGHYVAASRASEKIIYLH